MAVDEQSKLVHPDIILEMRGIETEVLYDGIIGPIPSGNTEEPPSYAERVAKACKNTGLDTIDQAQGVDKKQN